MLHVMNHISIFYKWCNLYLRNKVTVITWHLFQCVKNSSVWGIKFSRFIIIHVLANHCSLFSSTVTTAQVISSNLIDIYIKSLNMYNKNCVRKADHLFDDFLIWWMISYSPNRPLTVLAKLSAEFFFFFFFYTNLPLSKTCPVTYSPNYQTHPKVKGWRKVTQTRQLNNT